MKNNLFIEIKFKNNHVFIEDYAYLSKETRKILELEEKVEVYGQHSGVKKFFKNEEIYNFYQLLKSYCKKESLQLKLAENYKKMIEKYEESKEQKKQKLLIADYIKKISFSEKLKTQPICNLEEFELYFQKLLSSEVSKKYLSDFYEIFNFIQKNTKESKRPYLLQLKNIYHYLFFGSSCNFSVPGSGKTLIALIIFNFLKSQKTVNRLLLIAPLNSYMSWKHELSDSFYGVDKNTILEINRFKKEDLKNLLDLVSFSEDEKICLINYENLHQNQDTIIDFLKKNDALVIYDEAHKIKNPSSRRSKAAKEISQSAKQILILTGTPMPKGYEDLKSYFSMLENFHKKTIIKTDYSKLVKLSRSKYRKQDIQDLEKNIYSFYSRITKNDLNLRKPNITYWNDFNVDWKHEKIYKIIEVNLISWLKKEEDKKTLSEIMKAKIFRLMQVSIDPRMVLTKYSGKIEDLDDKYNDEDEDEQREIITETKVREIIAKNPDEESDKKVDELEYRQKPERYSYCLKKVNYLFQKQKIKKIIIWSCWIYVIEELKKLFAPFYKVKTIYGKTDFKERNEILSNFQKKDDKIQILICNPSSVSESVSLHHHCHDAVYFDMTWNALHYMQSKERIHRYSKTNPMTNYYIITKNDWIDKQIWNNIEEKEKRMINMLERKDLKYEEVKSLEFPFEEILKIYKKK